MCRACETLFPLVAVVLIIAIVAISVGPKTIPSFTIETFSSSCVAEGHDLDIRTSGNSVVITAGILTPNPCYSVVGNVKFLGKKIEVDLSAVSKQGYCIQCIGEVTGKVVIQNLTKGTYDVQVKTPDKAQMTTIAIE